MNLNVKALTNAIEKKIDKSSWIEWKFSDLVDNIVEKVIPKESGLEHYIGLEHLDTGSLKIRRFGETAPLTGDKLKIYKGDLIFAKRNAYLKRVSIADFDAVASAHSLVLRPKKENVVPEFLAFFMLSEVFWQRAIEISVGSLSPTINWKVLAKQVFLLPPLDQQVELLKVFKAVSCDIDSKLNVLERHSTLIRAYRMEVFKRSDWPTKKLNDYFEVQLGKMLSKKAKEGKSPFKYLANQNVQWGKFNLEKVGTMDFNEKERDKFKLQKGDLLVCEGGEVGRAAIWNDNLENCYYQKALHRLRVRDDKYLPEIMLQFLIFANDEGLFKGLTSSTTIAHLTAEKLKELKIPDIELAIQRQLSLKFKQLNDTYEKASIAISSSKLLQKSVINKVF